MVSSAQNDPTDIVLMADPRVATIPVSDNGEPITDLRTHRFRVSDDLADNTGAFAHVRTGVMDRLRAAEDALPAGLHLLIIEGYRPPGLQKEYFDDYYRSLQASRPGDDHSVLRMLTSRYVSPPEIAPHTAGAAIDLTLCADDGQQLDLGTRVGARSGEDRP